MPATPVRGWQIFPFDLQRARIIRHSMVVLARSAGTGAVGDGLCQWRIRFVYGYFVARE
jgi:hypothetical protein